MEPKHDEKFMPSKCTAIVDRILTERLKDKEYNETDAKALTLDLCNEIKAGIKEECNIQRYKIMVQVALGKNDGQGIRVASKCLWDVSNDNYASFSFQNQELFAVGMVFGVYYE